MVFRRPRSISRSELNILWAQCGNLCAYRHGREACGERLVEARTGKLFTLGEAAHIVGLNPGSARHDGPRPANFDPNSHDNLILLCPNHHTTIDAKATRAAYSERVLRRMKKTHEAWVARALGVRTKGSFRILADFEPDPDDGTPWRFLPEKDEDWHYVMNLWVEGASANTTSVRYRLHPTFKQPHITIRTGPKFMLQQFKTSGDFYVRALLMPSGVATYSMLSKALRAYYGRSATSTVRKAIRRLEAH